MPATQGRLSPSTARLDGPGRRCDRAGLRRGKGRSCESGTYFGGSRGGDARHACDKRCGVGVGLGRAVAPATTINDSLTGGRTVATRRSGGTFTDEGWKVTNLANGSRVGAYLLYALPAGTRSGTVEFGAKGFRFGKQPDGSRADNREHFWSVWDKDGPHDSGNQASGYLLRFYDHEVPDGTFLAGSHRWRFISPETSDIDADKKSPVARNSQRWYRIRFEWSQTQGRWFKDGVLQGTVSTRNLGRSCRYAYVGSDYRSQLAVPGCIT